MAIEVSWYDEDKTIIVQKFPADWTWDEFYAAVKETVELEKTVDHTVYVLGTQPPEGRTPKGSILQHYNSAIAMHEDNMRYYIIATDNRVTSMFGNVFLKTTPMRKKVRMAASFDDALRYIQADKEKLTSG